MANTPTKVFCVNLYEATHFTRGGYFRLNPASQGHASFKKLQIYENN